MRALGLGAAQAVQREARGHRDQPRLRIVERGDVLRLQAQPGVVQHVLGVGRRAEHAVGQAEQAAAVAFEQGGSRIHGVLRVAGQDQDA